MAKAFWTIVGSTGDGSPGNTVRPNVPQLADMRMTVPFDINRLPAGAAPADHVHCIVGNLAIQSDQAGGAHEHYVTDAGNTILRGTATAHTHANPGAPDFFMCFIQCSDATFNTLLTAHNVKPMVMVNVNVSGEAGAMDESLWNNASVNDWERKTFWDNRSLTFLGIALPAVVDRGSRLWKLLAGMFMSRRPNSDDGFRGRVN